MVGGGGAFVFRGICPLTSAIMSLTPSAVKSLSLRSDLRLRASCTDADDGVETDVIRALCLGTLMWTKNTTCATDPRSVFVLQCSQIRLTRQRVARNGGAEIGFLLLMRLWTFMRKVFDEKRNSVTVALMKGDLESCES